LPAYEGEFDSKIPHYLESDVAEDDEGFSVKTLTTQNYKELMKTVDPKDPLHKFWASEKKISIIVVVAQRCHACRQIEPLLPSV